MSDSVPVRKIVATALKMIEGASSSLDLVAPYSASAEPLQSAKQAVDAAQMLLALIVDSTPPASRVEYQLPSQVPVYPPAPNMCADLPDRD